MTYAEYLIKGNNFNKSYLMPRDANPPQSTEIFIAPTTSRSRGRSTADYINMAIKRERALGKEIRNEIVREIQQDSIMASKATNK